MILWLVHFGESPDIHLLGFHIQCYGSVSIYLIHHKLIIIVTQSLSKEIAVIMPSCMENKNKNLELNIKSSWSFVPPWLHVLVVWWTHPSHYSQWFSIHAYSTIFSGSAYMPNPLPCPSWHHPHQHYRCGTVSILQTGVTFVLISTYISQSRKQFPGPLVLHTNIFQLKKVKIVQQHHRSLKWVGSSYSTLSYLSLKS